MAGSDVNRDMKLAVAGKSIQTAGGFGNHVAGEGDDQIVPFGDGNKHLRRNRTAAGVVPAQQDLHPAAAAAARILQRLAPEGKLPGGNTEAYLPREAHSAGDGQPGDAGHQQAEDQRQRQLAGQLLKRNRRGARAIDIDDKRKLGRALAINHRSRRGMRFLEKPMAAAKITIANLQADVAYQG